RVQPRPASRRRSPRDVGFCGLDDHRLGLRPRLGARSRDAAADPSARCPLGKAGPPYQPAVKGADTMEKTSLLSLILWMIAVRVTPMFFSFPEFDASAGEASWIAVILSTIPVTLGVWVVLKL